MDNIELVISANGCTDNTKQYLFYLASAIPHLKAVWSDKPLGFAKATNAGIRIATADKIILLNNDTVLLERPKNKWLEMLDTGDISGVWSQYSPITKRRFAVFFCAMIDRKVFDAIGLLNEEYGVGGCEDIEFCYKAEQAGFKINLNFDDGSFPIYHAAEGTMLDTSLVKDWANIFAQNEARLASKYAA